MDLRNLPDGLDAAARCNNRREQIENELQIDLADTTVDTAKLGNADEVNCEQMFGHIAIPVGLAGPIHVHYTGSESSDVYIPIATTEGALVASVNRGCKAITASGGAVTECTYIGMTRSICLKNISHPDLEKFITDNQDHWTEVAESTSNYLKVLSYTIDTSDSYTFLTLACHCDEAMGMNMTTIAAQAAGNWIADQLGDAIEFVTVAGNVDSDKKPSNRTHDLGRGFKTSASITLQKDCIETVLKSDISAMAKVAHAKLDVGSHLAKAIGHNLHAANVIAGVFLATGQDAAHVVEGSLTDTKVTYDPEVESLTIRVDCPAILVGVRGGGTTLPSQNQCLKILLKNKTTLHPCNQLARSITSAVLAGEISLLAAQANHTLASAHKKLGR